MLIVKNINKTYKGQVSHQALKDISFNVEGSEFTAIMGRPAPEKRRFSISFRRLTAPIPATF
ncbi:hypothetical protein RSC2_02535 [Bacillus paralicheniformis]|nr:hypothetical protein RSC2_02535 [Bacillus paralicheniformis]